MYDDPGDLIKIRILAATPRSPIAVFEISNIINRRESGHRLKSVFGATVATNMLIRNMAYGESLPYGFKSKLSDTPNGVIRYRKYLGLFHKDTLKKHEGMLKDGTRAYKLFGST